MLSRLRSLWRNLVRRGRMTREIDDELRETFEAIEQEHRQAGLSPEEARRAATIQFGRVESLREHVHDVKAGAFVESWIQDVRYAVRLLRRGPLFAGFAIGSLALGIGATGAIFSLFDGIALRRLNVPEPDRLVVASWGKPGGRYNYSLPYPQFEAISQRSSTLEAICWLNPFGRVAVSVGGEPQAADGVYVSGDYYRTLRLTPALGRLIERADDRPGQTVAVLTHAYWQRRFGGRTDVIGTAIALNQVPFTIIGVEPSGFSGTEVGRPYDVSLPVQASPALNEGRPPLSGPFTTWLYVLARLKPGVTLAAAEQETATIFAQVTLDAAKGASAFDQQLAREYQLRLEPGARGVVSGLRDGYERWLGLLLMLLGAVLLLASLNVATLLLSRSDARQREIATRLALGAGRWRIVRQFLTESAVLAVSAGALGLALAIWGSQALLRIALPAAERVPITLEPSLRLMAFMAAVSVSTCLLFGLIPALRATSRPQFLATRQIGGPRRRMLDRGLVASQVALSLVLLVAAGLFLRTLGNLWAQDPGYNRGNVLMFSVDPRLAGKKADEIPRTFRRVLDEVKTVPGAQAVTMSAVRPVSDDSYFVTSFRHIGGKTLTQDQRVRAAFNHVAPGYFGTLGIPLIAGREFDERDTTESPKVVIISERMARHFEGNPIGQRLDQGPDAREVVGVVRDVRYARVKDAEREVVYFPAFQFARGFHTSQTIEVRYAGSAADILPSVREAVSRAEPALTMFRVKTLERQTEESFARERLLAMLTSYFGGFAVLLACIGLYGLMSYGVTQRTAEMGLRLALGAQPSAVRWLVVRESAWTVMAGVGLGLAGAFGAVRLVQSQLFNVRPDDPAALAGATFLLIAMAFGAAYLPARRASHIDPLTALRHE